MSRSRSLLIAFLVSLGLAGAATFLLIGHRAAANEDAMRLFVAYTLALEDAAPQLNVIEGLRCDQDDLTTVVEGLTFTGTLTASFNGGHHELVVSAEADAPPQLRWRELGGLFLRRDAIEPVRAALAAKIEGAYQRGGGDY